MNKINMNNISVVDQLRTLIKPLSSENYQKMIFIFCSCAVEIAVNINRYKCTLSNVLLCLPTISVIIYISLDKTSAHIYIRRRTYYFVSLGRLLCVQCIYLSQ